MFLGMNIKRTMRGRALGRRMAEYFFNDQMGEGLRLTETATIHKPLVALTLSRVGLMSLREDCRVEILPVSKYDLSGIPKIAVVNDCAPPELHVDRSDAGRFYDIVSPAEMFARYPLASPGPIVALHTRYRQ